MSSDQRTPRGRHEILELDFFADISTSLSEFACYPTPSIRRGGPKSFRQPSENRPILRKLRHGGGRKALPASTNSLFVLL